MKSFFVVFVLFFSAVIFGGCLMGTYTITTDSIKETVGIGGSAQNSLTIKNNTDIDVDIDFDGGTYLIPSRLKTILKFKNGLFSSSNAQSFSFAIAVTSADDSIRLSSAVRNWYANSWSQRSSEIWIIERSANKLYFR